MEKFDDILMQIAGQAGGIEPLFDTLFSWLYRKTDYFHVMKPNDKMGFPEGVAEKLLLRNFRRYEQAAKSHTPKGVSKEAAASHQVRPYPPQRSSLEHFVPEERCACAGHQRQSSPVAHTERATEATGTIRSLLGRALSTSALRTSGESQPQEGKISQEGEIHGAVGTAGLHSIGASHKAGRS